MIMLFHDGAEEASFELSALIAFDHIKSAPRVALGNSQCRGELIRYGNYASHAPIRIHSATKPIVPYSLEAPSETTPPARAAHPVIVKPKESTSTQEPFPGVSCIEHPLKMDSAAALETKFQTIFFKSAREGVVVFRAGIPEKIGGSYSLPVVFLSLDEHMNLRGSRFHTLHLFGL